MTRIPLWLCLLLGPPLLGAPTARAADFWATWGDGRAELDGYRLRQPRYGAVRDGAAVLIFVTEDFSDSARVKADPGKHPPGDVYPVLKLNAVRRFQTGIYDYSVMTSVFSRISGGSRALSPVKVAFSSQEWCGQVYHQLLPRGATIRSEVHSYFDGEADSATDLPAPEGGLLEDELALRLRSFAGQADLVAPGRSLTVPLLPSLLSARLLHRPLRWGSAVVSRAERPEVAQVPAGALRVWTYRVVAAERGEWTYQTEVAAPHRLVAWTGPDGERGELLGSARLPYWKLNGPGGEAELQKLGLLPESRVAGPKPPRRPSP